MANQTLTAGRLLMALVNISYGAGSFYADWNKTHIHNPRWPGHAKFHNGQTMSLGACLSTTSLYFLFRNTSSMAAAKDSIWTAAVIGSFYFGSAISAHFYPGTLWIDEEFGEGAPQFPLFAGMLVMNWVGYALEIRRLSSGKFLR